MIDGTTTILVIEDEEVLRESMADYLEDRDFRVLTAENGRVGLEVFEREHPDLVLTDLRMPEVDGLEVLRRVAELSPETPLIVVSGIGRIADSIRALRLGAWDYILKPVEDMSIISHSVNKALERARLLRENFAYQEHLESLVSERTAELERANAHLTSINSRLRSVVESTSGISISTDVAGFGSTLLDEFAKHMMASGGSLFIVEEEGLRLLHTLESGHVPAFIAFPLPEGSILERAIQERKPTLIENITEEKTIKTSGWQGYQDGSVLVFPLPDETGRVVGVLTLHNKTLPPFVEQDKEIGAILASYSCETLRAARSMESLRVSEKRFRELAEMLPEAVIETDLHMNLLFANKRTFELFGYSNEDIALGINALNMIAPDERKKARENYTRRMQGEKFRAIEYGGLKKDGTIIPMLLHMNPIIDQEAMTGFRGVIVDISEQKKAEEAIRESESKYRLLADNITDNIWIFNLKAQRFTYVSPSVVGIFGYTADEATGFQLEDILTPSAIELVTKVLLEELAKDAENADPGRSRTIELEQIHKDGRILWTEVTMKFVRDAEGRPEEVLGVTRDINHRKQLEAQLQQAQKMEAVGTLAGGIAHDFNNLLQAIIGYDQILLINKAENDADYSKLMGIQEAVERASKLVQQLLLFSRKVETERKHLDLNQEMEHALKLLERTIPRMIDIELHTCRRLFTINADPVQIEQVMLNLGSNAADAMPEGGKLIITIENASIENNQIKDNLEAIPGNYVILTVSDTGHGMDKETVEHIFEPFFTTKEIGKGTGLGLASAYGIIKSHGGYIRCHSDPGKGTVFKVYLPAEEQGEPDSLNDIEIKAPMGGSETILVVDDEKSIIDMASQILQKFGYTVLTALSGEEALKIYSSRHNEINLALIDIGMPGMGGHKCLREILRINPFAKVIVSSGYAVDGQVKRTLEAGAAGYIGKPYQLSDLLNKVRTVLDDSG